MAKFNPYVAWLRIPADQLPPDYYRLLGLRRFETDVAKIEASVEKRVAFLQDVSNGPHVDFAQKLLSEVARARLCLKNPARRQKYDDKLRSTLAAEDLLRELPEITELPDPDEWLFKGSLPEARSIQSTRQRMVKDPLTNVAATPISTPRRTQPAEPEGSKALLPVIIISNIILLAVIGGGIYWIMTDPNEAEVIEVEKERAVAKKTIEKSTDPVSIDFESKLLAADAKSFDSKFGSFTLNEGVCVSDRDEGQRHLHFTGGENRQVTIAVNPAVAYPAKLTMMCERWTKKDLSSDKYFIVEISSDNQSWVRIEPDFDSQRITTRERSNGPVSCKVIYIFEQVDTKSIRLTCNSLPQEGEEPSGGLLIGEMTLAPITDLSELNRPTF